jgi:hypothetical protein
MTQHYIFELQCPQCGALGEARATKRDIPPPILCDTCDNPAEMRIVSVQVGDDTARARAIHDDGASE